MTPSWLVVMSFSVTAVLSLIDAILEPTAPAWQVLRGISAGILLASVIWWLISKRRQSQRNQGRG
jgi:hypothetical protein